jgi:probable HAF family extracellular repeat protein
MRNARRAPLFFALLLLAAAPQPSHYTVTMLGSLGGSVAAGISVNDFGAVSGFSTLSGNATVHAALWPGFALMPTDLSTLGGANSAVEWPNHDPLMVVGISQTTTPDPLSEQWSCSAFIPYTGDTCLGFAWRGGRMVSLPTLGGNNGFATGDNYWGAIVGWAETSVHDPTCVAPQVLGFEAVLWDPDRNPHPLPPLAGDPDSAATAINDEGDVAGISGICQNAVGDLSAEHMVLWRDGIPMNIGNLGGAGWNTPMAINDLGEVVGFSDLPGDQNGNAPNSKAFVWTRGNGLRDLGALPDDVISQALGVNIAGQIVGLSCPTGNCSPSRAFIYQDGKMTDLNALVPAGSPYLVYANDIDDEGVITGLAVMQSGAAVAFRASPSYGKGWNANPRDLEREAAAASRALRALGLRVGPFGRLVPKLP